jgi:transposase-like protein
VKGRWCYLYRAIDSTGATIDFLLSAKRDANAAKRLFCKTLSVASHPQPRVINTDLAPTNSPVGRRLLARINSGALQSSSLLYPSIQVDLQCSNGCLPYRANRLNDCTS